MWNYRNATTMAFLLIAQVSAAGELATYRFVETEPVYRSQCGECSVPFTTRARVEGTFTVEFDLEAKVGTLLTLDANLTDLEGFFGDDAGGGWRPHGEGRDFLPRWMSSFRPPHSGDLSLAEYRPLGPQSLTDRHREQFAGASRSDISDPLLSWMWAGVGWEHATADALQLSPAQKNSPFAIWPRYSIYLDDDVAYFTYNTQQSDFVQTIAGARAVRVPSPSSLPLAGSSLLLVGIARRRRTDRVRHVGEATAAWLGVELREERG